MMPERDPKVPVHDDRPMDEAATRAETGAATQLSEEQLDGVTGGTGAPTVIVVGSTQNSGGSRIL